MFKYLIYTVLISIVYAQDEPLRPPLYTSYVNQFIKDLGQQLQQSNCSTATMGHQQFVTCVGNNTVCSNKSDICTTEFIRTLSQCKNNDINIMIPFIQETFTYRNHTCVPGPNEEFSSLRMMYITNMYCRHNKTKAIFDELKQSYQYVLKNVENLKTEDVYKLLPIGKCKFGTEEIIIKENEEKDTSKTYEYEQYIFILYQKFILPNLSYSYE